MFIKDDLTGAIGLMAQSTMQYALFGQFERDPPTRLCHFWTLIATM